MTEWFFDRQLKITFILGIICLAIIFTFDFRGLQALSIFLVSLVLIFSGFKLYAVDSSENWLNFSYSEIIKNGIGGALMIIGWLIFLRGVLALAIGSLILRFG